MERFLPTSREQMDALGWEQPDVVFVSGDGYVDHPSFAAAILGRWLESHGFRVAILAQPDWKSVSAWRALGPPKLFYAVSAGAMDSMINHYTANRKRRNADAYSPNGEINMRPDRANAVYAQRCREAFKGIPVIAGGVEASLRRAAHYDYWSDKVLPSSLVSSKADLVAFGSGENTLLTIAQRLAAGETVRDLRDLRGVAYLLGKREEIPDHRFDDAACDSKTLTLPSYEDVTAITDAFARATRRLHQETNPLNARRLVQPHGDRSVVINPPPLPLTEAVMDAVHDLPYTRKPHPSYDAIGPIPAWQTIKDSVQIMRGCFGGCTFCSITLHQGRAIQSRSQASVMKEVKALAKDPDFKGHVSDLGGPTANMYRMRCSKPEVEAICRRLSCVDPKVCKLLDTSHTPLIQLMKETREVPGIKKINIASGIRMDLARKSPGYMKDLVEHHVGGHLKVAPEHVSDSVLALMKKPAQHTFEEFGERFKEASRKAGKDQYLVPYFIASHPGSGIEEMVELAQFLKKNGYRPEQVQDFIPAPMDIATCMFYTGIDPTTMKPVKVARNPSDRAPQRALLQFFMPENYRSVRQSLEKIGREDLIGDGPECLIPENPPKGAYMKKGKAGGGAKGRNRGKGQGGYRWAARRDSNRD
ncbi:MAG: YgiQ family radical SAM protein [Candidatus Latescibacteria bacterium]|nr:YgiQ family radical SAM protein [Candidatus Latescibacterota bacterium]